MVCVRRYAKFVLLMIIVVNFIYSSEASTSRGLPKSASDSKFVKGLTMFIQNYKEIIEMRLLEVQLSIQLYCINPLFVKWKYASLALAHNQ